MKEGLKDSGLLDNVYLMCQPLGYHCPDAGRQGFIDLPEFPFGLGTQSFILFEGRFLLKHKNRVFFHLAQITTFIKVRVVFSFGLQTL